MGKEVKLTKAQIYHRRAQKAEGALQSALAALDAWKRVIERHRQHSPVGTYLADAVIRDAERPLRRAALEANRE